MGGVYLSMAPVALGMDSQAVLATPLTAGHRAVHEGGGHIVELGLVDLLLNALAPVLEDDGDLVGISILVFIWSVWNP